MAFGPKLCACCGSTEGVEAHHLYSRRADCPDDLTVWLCFTCRGWAHERRQRVDATRLTAGAMAATKTRGMMRGSYPRASMPDPACARAARVAKADAFATRMGPTVRELRASGLSLNAIAMELTRRGEQTAGGGKWSAQGVKNLLARSEAR